jgi:hypothetical protein
MDKSMIFTQYNILRQQGVSPARLNKALSIVQSRTETKYFTTHSSCTCPDNSYRGVVCKHMLALIMVTPDLAVGDQVSVIMFPEVSGRIMEIEHGDALVKGQWYDLRELDRNIK